MPAVCSKLWTKPLCWTQWFRENYKPLKNEQNIKCLKCDQLKLRDLRFSYTSAHAVAASPFPIEFVDNFLSQLKKLGLVTLLVATDKEGDNPLHSAIRSRASPVMVSRLLNKVPKLKKRMLSAVNKKGEVPLQWAFNQRHWKAVALILEECVKTGILQRLSGVGVENIHCTTLLHLAFQKGDIEYLKILLKVCDKQNIHKLSAIRIPDENDNTPWFYLMSVDYDKFSQALSLLSEHSIDLNALYLDAKSKTLMLHEANRRNDSKLITLLRRFEAKETLKDANGLLPRERNRKVSVQHESRESSPLPPPPSTPPPGAQAQVPPESRESSPLPPPPSTPPPGAQAQVQHESRESSPLPPPPSTPPPNAQAQVQHESRESSPLPTPPSTPPPDAQAQVPPESRESSPLPPLHCTPPGAQAQGQPKIQKPSEPASHIPDSISVPSASSLSQLSLPKHKQQVANPQETVELSGGTNLPVEEDSASSVVPNEPIATERFDSYSADYSTHTEPLPVILKQESCLMSFQGVTATLPGQRQLQVDYKTNPEETGGNFCSATVDNKGTGVVHKEPHEPIIRPNSTTVTHPMTLGDWRYLQGLAEPILSNSLVLESDSFSRESDSFESEPEKFELKPDSFQSEPD